MIEGQGQLAGGVDLAEKDFRQRGTARLAGIPGQNLSVALGDIQRRADSHDGDHRLARGRQGIQHLLLGLGQVQVQLVAGGKGVAGIALFALQGRIQADAGDDDVGMLGDQLALGRAVIFHAQVLHTVLEQVGALGEEHAHAVFLRVGADALQEGHIAAGRAVVVALQRRDAVGVGTDDGDGLDLFGIQGQHAVVLQQYHRFFRRGQGQGVMLIGVAVGEGDRVVFAVIRQETQHNAAGVHPLAADGDVFLSDQAFLVRLHHMQVGVAAVQVAAHLEGQGGGLGRGIGDHVAGMEIADGPAVGSHMTFEAPLLTQDIHQQGLGAAGRFAVDAVVRAHECLDIGFLDGSLEGGQVGLPHVLGIGDSVELMTDGFGTGMHRKVLGAGGRLEVLALALQALDEAHAQAGGQVGILAVGLMAAAPAGITEDVDVGAPHGQALVDVAILMGCLAVVLGTGFMADDLGDLLMEIFVKDSSQTDRLGEHRCRTGTGDAMEGFVPPVIGRDAQTRNGGRVEAQLGGLLLQSHLRNQFMGLTTGFFSVHHMKICSFRESDEFYYYISIQEH